MTRPHWLLIISLTGCGAIPASLGSVDSNSDFDSWESSASDTSGDSSSGSGDSSSSSGNSSQGASSAGSSSLPLLSTSGVGSTVLGLGLLIWAPSASSGSGDNAKGKRARRQARLFLRAQGYQLAQDLAVGAGPSLEDLAAAAELRPENLARFSRLLHAHRVELLALAQPSQLTEERAVRFFERVGELARTDLLLRREALAFLARHELER